MIHVNSAGSITAPKNFTCQPESMNSKQIYLLCYGEGKGGQNKMDIFQGHGTGPLG